MSSTEAREGSARGRRLARRLAVGSAVVLAAGSLVGGVVAGQMDWSDSAEDLSSALLEDPAVRVAEIPSANGRAAHGVFAQLTSTGHFCVWEAASASARTRGGGCNLADDPLGERLLSVSLAYDGGPSVATVTDAKLFGFTEANVAGLEVLMSNGSRRTVSLRPAAVGALEFQAFGYRVRKSDLRRGVEPIAVLAVDSEGAELDRQETGFTG
jgi:hypothetical protein